MKPIKNHSFALFLICFGVYFLPTAMQGQRDSHLALYKYHMQTLNPAFIGTQGSVFLNTTYRRQWSALDNGPQVRAVSLGIPSEAKRLNYGVLIFNDQTFIERKTQFFVSFSYKLELNDTWDLFLGLNGGGENFGVDFNELKNVDTRGDRSLDNFSRFSPNVGLGLYLRSETYYFALSAPKLLQTKLFKDQEGISTTATDRMHLYATAGLKHPLSGSWYWVASVLARYVDAAPWSLVVNTGMAYNNYEFNLGYQWDSSYSATLMLQTNTFLSFGYSYQFPSTSGLATLTGGNHELLVKIRLKPPAIEEETPTDEIPDTTIETTNQIP